MKSMITALLLTAAALMPVSAPAAAKKSAAVEMRGTVRVSFERAEFVHQGQTYYLDDAQGVLTELIRRERDKSKAFLVEQNICISGRIKTRAQNKNRGFGALERYEQAVLVEKSC